jgi:UTP--glucose-1-phosphate uridylyltransferase
MKVTKAVFPVAGLGTRFLPATKANPKEMLPIVDKPLIQYAVEEAIAAGITELIFVTSSRKRAIEDHFDRDAELERSLFDAGKDDLLKIVEDILPQGVNCVYIRQSEQLGLGHAVACAKSLINDEPFAVLLADDLIDSGKESCLQKMLQQFSYTAANIVGVQEMNSKNTGQYGVIELNDADFKRPLVGIVEKPAPKDALSNFGVVGRYILTADIWPKLAKQTKGAGGEIQLTDAIAALIPEEKVYAHHITGTRYDCGNKLGYLKATVNYGLKHPDLYEDFKAFLAEIKD